MKVGIGTNITTTTIGSVEPHAHFPCLAHIRSHTYVPVTPPLDHTSFGTLGLPQKSRARVRG